jgi:DNA-binding IclR family transcriptional regulator
MIKRIGLPAEDEWPGITAKDDLIKYLERIRNDGMEVFCNSNYIAGLSTPIFRNNKIIAGLGIYFPESRFGSDEQKNFPDILKKTTEYINARINGY